MSSKKFNEDDIKKCNDFLKEYKELCLKHGVFIDTRVGYSQTGQGCSGDEVTMKTRRFVEANPDWYKEGFDKTIDEAITYIYVNP